MSMTRYVHLLRLESDYTSMTRLTGHVITWQHVSTYDPLQGIYPDKYHVTFNILAPTVAGDASQHVLEIDCSSQEFPRRSPDVKFLTPTVRHPNVFADGRVCLGGFPLGESLAELCIRLARIIQYDPTLINPHSIASGEFHHWYQRNKARFPIDRSPLPSPYEDTPGGTVLRGGIKIKRRFSETPPDNSATE